MKRVITLLLAISTVFAALIQESKDNFGGIIFVLDPDLQTKELSSFLVQKFEDDDYKKGAIHVHVPISSTYSHGKDLLQMGFQTRIVTNLYVQWYKWNDENSPNMVPPPYSSISGAFVLFLNPNEDKVLLSREIRNGKWRLNVPGGSVNQGELDYIAAIREVGEEIGLQIENPDPTKFKLIGSYNQINARKYDDIQVSDHFHVFLTHVDENVATEVDNKESHGVFWVDAIDVANGKVPSVMENIQKFLAAYLQNRQGGLKLSYKMRGGKPVTTTIEYSC